MTRPPQLNSIREKSYERYFFCSSCQEWIIKQHVDYDKLGRPRCPCCRTTLRTHDRHNRNNKNNGNSFSR